MQLKSRVLIEDMREEDIPQIQQIERQIFPTPWPKNAYYRELHHNRSAYYMVLRRDDVIVGYAGLWKMSDEAHITTVGVRAGEQYVDVGTLDGYRSAIRLLSEQQPA